MKEYRLTDWLPTTKKEVELRGWNELDVVLFSADAYVDHPSFGAAVIGRILEAEGLKIAIVPQPDWRDDLRDFKVGTSTAILRYLLICRIRVCLIPSIRENVSRRLI